jgi:hypothetical protein
VIRPIDQGDPLGGPEPMITAEMVNGIVRFQPNGLAVIDTGGSARQIAADLMPDQYPTAAQLRFPTPPREAGPREAGDSPP